MCLFIVCFDRQKPSSIIPQSEMQMAIRDQILVAAIFAITATAGFLALSDYERSDPSPRMFSTAEEAARIPR